MIEAVLKVLIRDLDTVIREIELYPSDAAPWTELPGLSNAGGTLALHLAGNLQHFLGATLGGTGYVRDRDLEFSRRGVPRVELVAELRRASEAVRTTLAGLDPARLRSPYPLPIQGQTVTTELFLIHLCAHLAYHLGQLDGHRRLAGQAGSAGAQSMAELLTGN